MKKLMTAALALGLVFSAAKTPAYAQGKGGGGGPRSGKGKQVGPQDGTGNQQGKRPKGKQTGPKDGSGPIHTPPATPPKQ